MHKFVAINVCAPKFNINNLSKKLGNILNPTQSRLLLAFDAHVLAVRLRNSYAVLVIA